MDRNIDVKWSNIARRIKPGTSWDNLRLPQETVSLLKDISSRASCKQQMFGKERACTGLTVLFTGPKETGMMKIAEVIASDLGIPLYRIDLSALVSKYIGETEKNLNEIFDAAETANAILYFDEADALFRKRTEVTDAHDRYANMEVSYLLQRLEQHNGLCILATNLRGSIDSHFTRRMQFLVDFSLPRRR